MKKLIVLMALFLTSMLFISHPVHAIEVINGPDVIYKQASSIVTINDILLLYSADGKFISSDVDNYTGNGATLGVYDVKLKATDGLYSVYRTIQVKVITSLGIATLADSRGYIYVRPTETLDFGAIRTILRNIEYISIPVGTGYQMLVDDYTGNEAEIGIYNYSFRLVSSTGSIQNASIKIFVTDEFTQIEPGLIIPGDPTASDSFFKFITDILFNVLFFGAIGFGVWFILFRKKRKAF